MKPTLRLIPENSLDEFKKDIDKDGNPVLDKKITLSSEIRIRVYPWQEYYAFEAYKGLGGLNWSHLLRRLLNQELERLLLKRPEMKPAKPDIQELKFGEEISSTEILSKNVIQNSPEKI